MTRGISGFLAGDDLKNVLRGILNQDPLEEHMEGWSYRLTVGDEAFVTSEGKLIDLRETLAVEIQPGDFALLITTEYLRMPPNYAGLISLRFGIKRKGLINISGFHVDPNFEGRLFYTVYNAGSSPITVRKGDPIFMLVLAPISEPITDNRISPAFDGRTSIDSETITSLRGPTVSLVALNKKVDKLRLHINVIMGVIGILLAPILIGTVIAVISHFLGSG